ncbi:phage tail protein [Anoxynatronum buryatiense]|uniref:Microcystin-dependent protein n=1 Tax=Anoxynatronum buryatiense TaxID=489973 RepID=A0AA46AK88_9CLOT|nr:tail fiber protein [Anoxynatronum buryatiense]SMP68452.1 Microcystin-dependent protein [Anoxynatronum buryatiense]
MKIKYLRVFVITLILCPMFMIQSWASDPYIGEIRMFAGNFAPVGWAFCEGQLISISENDTLFQIIGTTYGGDGETNFALPDLRGRGPVHAGNVVSLGEMRGMETVTLTVQNIPPHVHTTTKLTVFDLLKTTPDVGNVPMSAMLLLAKTAKNEKIYAPAASANEALGGTHIEVKVDTTALTNMVGQSQPVENIQPVLHINYIISLQGIYPSQF